MNSFTTLYLSFSKGIEMFIHFILHIKKTTKTTMLMVRAALKLRDLILFFFRIYVAVMKSLRHNY